MDTTVYQDQYDAARARRLRKITFSDSQLSKKDVFASVNHNVYHQMNCGVVESIEGQIRAGKLSAYRNVLEKLVSETSIDFVMAHELSKLHEVDSGIKCQIRHDVDADIVCCLPMAKIEADLGIQSTYYLLHTADYYGVWEAEGDEAIFKRNESLAEYYLAIQDLGHEIGIHTDPMHIYQSFNADGAEVIRAEISWLRSIGVELHGTAPHNNPAVYGASNSAIFEGRPVSEIHPKCYQGVIHNDRWAPLNQLSERSLGLEYEADDVYSMPNPVDFISMVSENRWWRMFRDPSVYKYILEKLRGDASFDATAHMIEVHPDIYQTKKDFEINDEFLSAAVLQSAPKAAILSIHPEYYGWRESEGQAPAEVAG